MLRAAGLCYRALEDAGQMLVVTEMNIRYHKAAEFDDLLDLSIRTLEVRKVRIRHRYLVQRDGVSNCRGRIDDCLHRLRRTTEPPAKPFLVAETY